MEITYIIRSRATNKMIEAHDSLSLAWAQSKVETHNWLYPYDQWFISEEQI
jgi:hypothetical protein